MIEKIQNVYSILVAVQLFPMVTLAALGCYFIVRQRYEAAKIAVWAPVGMSFIGQIAFAWPTTVQDLFMSFTMGVVQAGLAIGIYSFADKYGLPDRLGKLVQKKMEDKNATPPVA